ncbi:MAG: (d)CMP kinase [Acidobacteriia bacterium]|nr:(d)CMP kinase [Terriglobia bacterium]
MPTCRNLIIAIDGPAGSGKSTVGRKVAEHLGYFYVDTGAMYRAAAWKALQMKTPLDDAAAMTKLVRDTQMRLACDHQQFQISIDGVDVTRAIRAPEVSEASSRISTIAPVRRELVAQQQLLGKDGGVVMEGRDIGTVVFPDADVKIFLDATPEARGERRYNEDVHSGKPASRELTIEAVRGRDQRDASREASPMMPAPDAAYIDTTRLTIDQVVEKILALVAVARGTSSSK